MPSYNEEFKKKVVASYHGVGLRAASREYSVKQHL